MEPISVDNVIHSQPQNPQKIPFTNFLKLTRTLITTHSANLMDTLQQMVTFAVNDQDPVVYGDMHNRYIMEYNHNFFSEFSNNVRKLDHEKRLSFAKMVSEVVKHMKNGHTAYIVGAFSNSIYSKDEPNEESFTFTPVDVQKICDTRDFLNNHIDTPYVEKVAVVPLSQIFGGKYEWVKHHSFIFDESGVVVSPNGEKHIDVHF